MATTKTTEERFNGTGTKTVFPFTIEYLSTSDLQVFVNNVLQTETTNYSIQDGDLTFVTAPVSGYLNVKISRSTDIDKARATYSAGSSIRAQDLTNNQDQVLFALQERLIKSHTAVSSTAPTNPVDGDRWYDSVSGRTYVYFEDADSSQWVEASPAYETSSGTQTTSITDAQIVSNANIAQSKLNLAITDNEVSSISTNKVSFTQTGTGALSTTLSAKLQEIVSVKDFGAKGDNSTDDTAAIQAAITAAKHVVFPEGTYLINDKLNVTQADTYIEGLGTVEIKQTTYPQHVFFITGNNCTIRNLKLTGVPTKTELSESLGNRYYGDNLRGQSSAIYLLAADDLDVLDCNIVKFFAGIKIRGGQSHSWVKLTDNHTGNFITNTTFQLKSSDQQADDFWQGDAINGFGYIRVFAGTNTSNVATSNLRLSDYVNSTNTVTFTSQSNIAASSNTFAYNLTKGRSKNILISGCRFDLVDMGILGNHVENLVIENSIFETIEQTQQDNVRPHSIYLTGGDNKKVKASGLITYNCPNGDAYKFLAVDGLFLSDLDAYNSRGTITAEGCIHVTGNNLTCLLSGDLDPAITTSATTDVSASTIGMTAHGLASGTPVILRGLTNTTGSNTVTVNGATTTTNLSNDRVWYVSETSNTANSFRLTTASNGAASGNFTFGGSDDTGITIFNTAYFAPNLASITASRFVYLSDLTLTLDEDYDATLLATYRPSIVKIIGNDDIDRGDLGTMLASSTIVPSDIHIRDIIIDAKGYTGDVRGVLVERVGTNTAYKPVKSTFENISIVNGSASTFKAVRVVHGDNITIRYPSYTKGDAPSTKQVQLDVGCTNSIVVLHPDQSDFTFTNTNTNNSLIYPASNFGTQAVTAGDITSSGTLSVLTGANPQLKLIDSTGDPDSFATITYNNGNDSNDNLIFNVDAGNSTTGHQPDSHMRFYVDGNQEARIDANGLKVYGNQIDFTSIPTSDPSVAGRLWRDGTDLKISIG